MNVPGKLKLAVGTTVVVSTAAVVFIVAAH